MRKLLCNHGPFIFIVPLFIIVLTWPTFPSVFDAEGLWLHTGGWDMWYKFWDAWHIKRVLAGQADYYFTDAVFHPHGVSLAFHQIAAPHALAFAGLQAIMPAANAYNLCFLLMLLFNATAVYVLLRYLFSDGLVSVFGACVLGLTPLFASGITLPDLILVGTMPLAIYSFQRAVTEERQSSAALSGIAIGVTALIGLYIYICLLMTLAIYGVSLALSRWKTKSFWLMTAVAIGVAGTVSTLRFYPIIADKDSLSAGLSKYSEMRSDSADVADFLVNESNPLTGPILRDVFQLNPLTTIGEGYLGYVPLMLIAIGLIRGRERRAMLPWLALLCFFLVLRAGDHLTIDGKIYFDILLPKFYLNQLFPLFFDAFGISARFQIGVILPFAVLSCFGLSSILSARPPIFRFGFICLCLVLLALEYFVPVYGSTLDEGRIAHLEWLRREDSGPLKLINLPMRRLVNKHYMFLQTLNGYPQANGVINRTPSAAYKYLDANYLLRAWSNSRNINCAVEDPAAFEAAVAQLQDDGFSHVVFHPQLPSSNRILAGLTTMKPSYADDHVLIFRMDDLLRSCHSPEVLSHETFAPYRRLADTEEILPDDYVSIISLHPSKPVDYAVFEDYSSVFSEWRDLLHVFRVDDDVIVQSLNERYSTTDDIVALNDALLLIYDPTIVNSSQLLLMDNVFGDHFRLCERVFEASDTVFEYYVKPVIPCPLLLSDKTLRASYESGIQLHRLYFELSGRRLDIYALWRPNTEVRHAFSIQMFDERGQKAIGQDFVIHFEPAIHYRVDLSSLALGEYHAKLIVYNYDTGVSIPGVATIADTPFDRELEMGRLTIE